MSDELVLLDPSPIDKLDLKPKDIATIIHTFLTDHSSRKYNYIFWNITNNTAPVICFSNLPDHKIERINDPKLCFRLVKVLNRKSWKVLSFLFNEIILKDSDKRSIQLIRVDYLTQYLKLNKYDFSAIDYTINSFGTRMLPYKETSRPFVHIVHDIHCQYLMDKLHKTYLPYLTAKVEDAEDVSDQFTDVDTQFEYSAFKGKLIIKLTDGLDSVSSRFLKKLTGSKTAWKLLQVKLDGDAFNIINLFRTEMMTVVSIRVYMHYFLKVIKARNRKDKLEKKDVK